jgi:prevent-host-death family protein
MKAVTATHAKNSFLEILRGAEEHGEEVLVTRNGRPCAVVVSAEEWEALLETIEILSDPDMMRKVNRALRERKVGRFLSHEEVWKKVGLPTPLPSGRRVGSRSTPRPGGRPGPKRAREARAKPAAR